MKQWWNTLQSREQILVLAGLAVIVIFIFYTLIVSPLLTSRQQHLAELDEQRELLIWVEQSGARLRELGVTDSRPLQQTDRSVLAAVDTMSKQLGVRPAIKRIEPSGDSQVTLWVEDMPFDSLMLLLGRLDKQAGIFTQNADIKRTDQPGKASAKLVLKRNMLST